MTPERWREVRAVLDPLVDAPEPDRERELAALESSDPELAHEVRSLLAANARHGSLLASSSPTPGHDRSGERVGAWELLSPLGEGGMGAVHLARRADASFEKRAAIKFVRAELLSPLLRARFAAERQTLAALEHPGIARLLDGGESESGEPYLVLEYVEGRQLLDFATERKLPLRGRIELFLQVLAAVSHAHRHLVVHRDLKPSNILVTAEGEPKLLDFGVAKILADDRGGGAPETRTLLRALTPEYAAPERILGGATTTATDVYSLGVVLYELSTGHRPFRVATGAPEEWAEAALHQEAARDAALDRDLDAIVRKALAKESGERYATADAFADDLRRWLIGRPVGAREASLADRAAKFVRRHRWAVALAATALLAIVGTALLALAQAAEARRERDRAERRFAEVRTLAGRFLFDVHDAVAPLAGSTEARSLLLTTGLEYLDRLAAEAGDDPELLRELAAGYERLGTLQGSVVVPNLGKSQDSLATQEKALELRRRLSALHPDDAELARELARSELAMGQAGVSRGRTKDAHEYSTRALAALERAAALEPENVEATRAHGEALTAHGFFVAISGDLAGADATLARAVEILEPVHASRPDDPAATSALGLAIFRWAQIRGEQGSPEKTAEALAILDRALALDREIYARAPDDPGVRRRYIADLAQSSEWRSRLGQHEAALTGYTEVQKLAEENRARDPSDAHARRNASILRIRIAMTLLAVGRPAEARAAVTPAVEDLGRMVAADPGNLFVELSLADAAFRLGQALHQLARSGSPAPEPPGRLRQLAREQVTSAIARLEPLVENGTLINEDAQLLDDARRELAEIERG